MLILFRPLISIDDVQTAKGAAHTHSIPIEFVDSFCRNIYSTSFFSQSVPLFASSPPSALAGEIAASVGANVLSQRRDVVKENLDMYFSDPYDDAAQVCFSFDFIRFGISLMGMTDSDHLVFSVRRRRAVPICS